MNIHTKKTVASIERLRRLREQLKHLGLEILNAGNKSIYPLDMVIIGIIKRCLSISSALEKVVLDWNMTCARALLRMQLDTVLRFSAFWLSSNPHDMANNVIAGKQINKMRDADGEQMTDSYLAKKLGKDFNWVPKVYKYTSGYIHFSERHLFDTIKYLDEVNRTINFVISEQDDNFPEFSWIELVDCATDCMQITMNYLEGYLLSKRNQTQVLHK